MGGGVDSGRSWVVAGACFVVQVLTFGLTEASGLLFVATIPRFETSREKASLPYTIAYCMRSAVGPAIGYLGRRFGIRLVTLFGCVLSALSVASCFFATDILELTILWGVIFGFSLGLETSLLNVILNEHFEKHLVKANGLNISGASLGTLLLSPVIEHSVEAYGLSGTFLIISGLMLNSIPAAMIMIINKPNTSLSKYADRTQSLTVVEGNNEAHTNRKSSICTISPFETIYDNVLDNTTFEQKIDDTQSKKEPPLILELLKLNSMKAKLQIIPRFWNFKRYSLANVFNASDFIPSKRKESKERRNHSHSLPALYHVSAIYDDSHINNFSPRTTDYSRPVTYTLPSPQFADTTNSKSPFQSSFVRTSLNTPFTNDLSHAQTTIDNIITTPSMHNLPTTNPKWQRHIPPFSNDVSNAQTTLETVVTTTHNPPTTNPKWQLQRLFQEPIYIVIIIGSGVYYFVITTFLTVIVDYATDMGISVDYSTYIVMWIALCDIFGYLLQSWLIELRHLSRSQFTALSFMSLCASSAAMVWCSHFVLLLVLVALFEFAQCGVIILSAPLVAEFMEKDLHATGIASLTILSSPMTLAISPLIGLFRDGGGSYGGVFCVISAASFLCSILFLCIPKLEKRREIK